MPQKLQKYHRSEWRGLGFPIGKRGVPTFFQDDINLVFSSVLQILNTKKGERCMLPTFGSDAGRVLWEPHDQFLRQDLRDYIVRDLLIWEPRITVTAIAFDPTPQQLNLGIIIVSIEVRLKNNPRYIFTLQVPISSGGGLTFRNNV